MAKTYAQMANKISVQQCFFVFLLNVILLLFVSSKQCFMTYQSLFDV